MMEPITKKKVIYVEGNDEMNFFHHYLKSQGISGVQIISAEGKDNFKNLLPKLPKRSGFSDVETLVVIVDADNDAASAFESITNSLKRAGLTNLPDKPGEFSAGEPKVGIYILPGDSNPGMLEDLCLKLIREPEVMNCVDHYFSCCKDILDFKLNRIAKRKWRHVLIKALMQPAHPGGPFKTSKMRLGK